MEFQSDSEPTVEPIGKAPENMPFPIPEKWKWVFMGNVTKRIHYGFTASAASMGNAKFLRITDIQNGSVNWASVPYCDVPLKNLSTFQLHEGNIVIARTGGTIGKSYLILNVEDVSVFASYLIRLIPSMDHLDPQYAMIFLNSPEYWLQLKQMSQGTGQPNVNTNSLSKLRIPIPPLGEQQRIVTKIKSLLAEIDRAEKAYNTLTGPLSEQYKALILDKAMRGQLVPQLDSEPEVEQIGEVSEDVPLEIPAKWKWVKLENLSREMADGPFGSNLKKEHYTNKHEVRIIQLSNIGEHGWRDENVKYTTHTHAETIPRSRVNSGDIVIAKMMPAGRAVIVPDSDASYVLCSDAVKVVVKTELILTKFLNFAINSQIFKQQVYANVQGTTRVRTSLSKLKTYQIPVPPLEEQSRIVAKIEALFSQVEKISV